MYLLLVSLALAIAVTSCRDNNPVGRKVQQYKSGEISEDSLLRFTSDSINISATLAWANSHKDNDIALFLLGRVYTLGIGIPKNAKLSKAYYMRAIDIGNIRAMQDLAVLYVSPECENLDSAYYWFKQAANRGLGDSYFGLAATSSLIRQNSNLPVDTAQQLKYILQGFNKGSVICTTELAKYYLSGFGVKKDSKKAYGLLISLPDEELNAEALFVLGKMFENGEGAPQNFNKSTNYFRRSSNKGNTNATCQLGVCYQMGQGVEQSDSLAFFYYKKAANDGNAWAQRNISTCYIEGIGTDVNLSKGFEWVKMAARNGDIEAIKYCKQHNLNYKE